MTKRPSWERRKLTEEMFTSIFNKVEGSEKVLKHLKNDLLHFISNSNRSFSIYKVAGDPIVPDLHSSQSKAKGNIS